MARQHARTTQKVARIMRLVSSDMNGVMQLQSPNLTARGNIQFSLSGPSLLLLSFFLKKKHLTGGPAAYSFRGCSQGIGFHEF